MLDTTIKVKTDFFDGPLSLLLLLIQKEEMDIKNLNLTSITKQYLAYLGQMSELNFDLAGDYLYLASTLLLLKSKSCLESEEEKGLLPGQSLGDLNITSESELIRRLEELHKFQKMGAALWGLPKKGHEIFVRPKINRKAIINSILTPIDLEVLTQSFIEFMQKERRKYTVIKRDRLSIREKLEFLKKHLSYGEETDMSSILESDTEEHSIINIVITFISLLELARLKKINIYQNESFGKVYIKVVEKLDQFDVALADGLDDENENEEQAEIQRPIEDSYARPRQKEMTH